MNAMLGKTGTDTVTGFKGTITGYVEYLTGCNQVLIVPKAKNGALGEAHWFDIQRVKVAGNAIRLDNGATPGPDKMAPKR